MYNINLVVVQLDALSLQSSTADGTQTKTSREKLQSDRCEERGRVKTEACASSYSSRSCLAALLLHPGNQHYNLMKGLQTQLKKQEQQMKLKTDV